MGMFDDLTTDGMEENQDVLGGGFQALPTDVYEATIKAVYAGVSKAGAKSLTTILDINGQEVTETHYYTKRTGENFYVKEGKKHPMPSFTTMDDLCLLVTGFGLAKQNTEEKTLKLYNFESRSEVPTPVQCITALHGKPIKVGLRRVIEDKTKHNPSTGEYDPTGETRTVNEINKFFHAETGKTVVELRNKVEEAEFMANWKDRFAGKDKDTSTSKAADTGGATGSGMPGMPAGGATAHEGGGLFG